MAEVRRRRVADEDTGTVRRRRDRVRDEEVDEEEDDVDAVSSPFPPSCSFKAEASCCQSLRRRRGGSRR